MRITRLDGRRAEHVSQEEAQEPAWGPIGVAWDAWRALRRGRSFIAARQGARLTALVRYARRHSRYYAALYQQLPAEVSDVRQLPPVSKAALMAQFDDWVTDPAITRAAVDTFIADPALIGESFLGRYLIWTTSGTTGTPAILIQDHAARAVYTPISVIRNYAGAMSLRAFLRLLWQVGRRGWRVAALLATGGHYAGVVMAGQHERGSHWRKRRIRVSSVQAPLDRIVQELNEFQPGVLTGYASALALLAEAQVAGRLTIDPVLVISTAEQLRPWVRRRIEAAFGCRVLNAYGSSEVGGIAFECRAGQLHVNADWVILEPVDANYQPVPPGQVSHTVLVTNLANYVQPIIRYDLGDQVMIDPLPCACGSPLPVITVEGRTNDLLSLTDLAGRAVQLLPLGLISVVEEIPGVRRFQLIQTGPAQIDIRLEAAAESVRPLVEARLRAYLATHGLANVHLRQLADRPAPDPRSGKFRHVWADMPAR